MTALLSRDPAPAGTAPTDTGSAGHTTPLDFFAESCENDSGNFEALLTASLAKAKELAHEQLKPALFDALEWPLTWSEYNDYLDRFVRWRPQQSGAEAWSSPGGSQEVYDRLCHFYWLIDQPVGPGGSVIVQNIPWFSQFLRLFAMYWGLFLDTPESFDQKILDTFIQYSPKYRVQDSMIPVWENGKIVGQRPNNPSGWLTFNQFFARELNPGLRPIERVDDNTVITCPADCTYKAQYPIDQDSRIPEICIKETHTYASITELLEGSRYAEAFAGGTFVHYFLGPYSYHRFHAPVDGKVVECYPKQGKVALSVDLANGQFDAPDDAKDGYEFLQTRGIITLDTSVSKFGDVGVVAVIPVGMCQVSSVNMTATVGSMLRKGEEFGYFLFGGSDIIVLFQEGTDPRIITDTNYRHYGTQMALCSKLG